jgi:hypothetical protein
MMRLAKISRLRAEIDAGTYETIARLDAAIEAFLDREVDRTRDPGADNRHLPETWLDAADEAP